MGDYVGGYGDGFLGKVLKKGLGAAMSIAGGPMGRLAAARLNLPHPRATGGALITKGAAGGVGPHVATHSAAIDTFVRRGGRFSAAGKAKLTQEHALAAGVHPALAAHFGRRRRMNWANPKALGRAERRISSALKHFTRFFRWAHPGKSAGHAVPKFHRKGSKKR